MTTCFQVHVCTLVHFLTVKAYCIMSSWRVWYKLTQTATTPGMMIMMMERGVRLWCWIPAVHPCDHPRDRKHSRKIAFTPEAWFVRSQAHSSHRPFLDLSKHKKRRWLLVLEAIIYHPNISFPLYNTKSWQDRISKWIWELLKLNSFKSNSLILFWNPIHGTSFSDQSSAISHQSSVIRNQE